jgi:fatty-acyl-CoA synthase
MIIRGGENIYPREIEDVLYMHPAILGASVVGMPDADWGEIPVRFVQAKPEARPSAAELEAFCRERLASYKVPRVWRFVDQFPQTASGKIQKFALREAYLSASV